MGMGLRGRGRRSRAAGRRSRAAGRRKARAKDRRSRAAGRRKKQAANRRRNRQRQAARRRRTGRRHRYSGGGGGGGGGCGLSSLFWMCCGCTEDDPIEMNREEIYELHQAQEMMLISLDQQGTVDNTSTNVNQPSAPGFQTVIVNQPSAPGFQTVFVSQPSAPGFQTAIVNQPSAQDFQTVSTWGPPPDYDSVMATPNPVQHQPSASYSDIVPGPSSEFSSAPYNNVIPPGTFNETVLNDHQAKQVDILSEIHALLEDGNDADTQNLLHSQHNEIVEQMRQMESLGYTYPGGVPPSLPVVDNPQHGTVPGTQ